MTDMWRSNEHVRQFEGRAYPTPRQQQHAIVRDGRRRNRSRSPHDRQHYHHQQQQQQQQPPVRRYYDATPQSHVTRYHIGNQYATMTPPASLAYSTPTYSTSHHHHHHVYYSAPVRPFGSQPIRPYVGPPVRFPQHHPGFQSRAQFHSYPMQQPHPQWNRHAQKDGEIHRSRRRSRFSADNEDSRSSSSGSKLGDDLRGEFQAEIGTRLDGGRKCYFAVKVVRSVKRYLKSAREEAGILSIVNERERRYRMQSERTRCVILDRRFVHDGHECLVFERLGNSLLDEQKRINYAPFDIRIIRHVSRQVLEGLDFLHRCVNLVHTDIKMENILFVRPSVPECSHLPQDVDLSTFDIKLIDFGGATFITRQGSNVGTINTRQYRAPEVILQIGWDCASDVWGAAAVMMELFLGCLLFQSDHIEEHLALMEKIKGQRFPMDMQRASMERSPDRYFDRKGRVIWPSDAEAQENIKDMRALEEIVRDGRSQLHPEDMDDFVEVLSGMFELHPEKRITAYDALGARFFRQ